MYCPLRCGIFGHEMSENNDPNPSGARRRVDLPRPIDRHRSRHRALGVIAFIVGNHPSKHEQRPEKEE